MKFRDFLAEMLKDSEFKKEYAALEQEYASKQQIIHSRTALCTILQTIDPPIDKTHSK